LQTYDVEAIREVIEYDPMLGVFRWKVRINNRCRHGWFGGTMNVHGYCQIRIFGKIWLAHRLAWLLMTGQEPPALIDHIDGDGTNNVWCNLRLATSSENGWNRKRKKGFTMRKDVKSKPYQAQIKVNGVYAYLGCFATEAEAHEAYREAAIRMHGEFVRLP
jgi:HNH endonuclease